MDFVSPVLNLIGSLLLTEYARMDNISDKLKTWSRKLPTIQDVMDSAEEKQMDDDHAVGRWLADLRNVAYDMEDLLEELSVETKRNSSKVGALSRSTKLPSSLIACCYRFNPRALFLGRRMAIEIEEVDKRLEEIVNRIPILGLVRNAGSRTYDDQPRFVTTSTREPKFVGREKQMEELLARLTQSEATEDSTRPFTVVSIVGMGGLGKTTLAQELYHHESLEKAQFSVKAWACVSDVFDRATITKNILEEVAPSSSREEKDLNQLQKLLNEKLSGKKFLIVLDDVWNDNYVELVSLLKPLYSGSKGSRILVTTRNIEVAKLVGDRDPRQLDQLPLEECLSLLAYHSIGEETFEGQPHLQDIAVHLAEKCKGLPLSVKTIGGLLRYKTDDKSWERVLAHGIWDREDGQEKIPPALKLSYVHLPIHLKRCFAACALFPKDYVFDQDEVIRLWIIQGLLHKGTTTTYQEVGMENLRRLEAVMLLQKARDEKTRYLMHDLINDLAKSVVVSSYFSSDEYKEDSPSREELLGKVRHAAMVTQYQEYCISKRFDAYRSMKKLRTFMPFQIFRILQPNVFVSSEVIQGLIMNMKNLRMLSLRYFRITEVPDRIGDLKLLRSVDFSYTEIKVLPESICDLVEFQSLILRGCTKLKRLPRNFHKLTNLLHLDIIDTNNLEEMPPRIGNMINLEVLSSFVVGKKAGQELKQLGQLKCIQRELHVRKLLVVNDVEDGKFANISEKEAVNELTLDWGSILETSSPDDHQVKLLDYLQPPGKTEYLAILFYGGKKFPSWFDNHCLNNVVRLALVGCKSVDSLPPIGRLPFLEWLFIARLEAVSSIGAEFYGIERPFQSLKSLTFVDMGAWEKWSSNGDHENDHPFPCLHELIVLKCPKLKGGNTLSLPSLAEILIEGCDERLLKCLVGLTSMTKMKIKEIPQFVHFDRSFSTSWVALEEMRIERCPRFKTFVAGDGEEQVPPKLKKLEIEDCEDLEKLPEDLSGLTSLNEMSIVNCGKLSSFPRASLPPGLRKVKLQTCPSLLQSQLISNRLPESLEELNLENLEGLESILDIFVGSQLSRALRILSISQCGSLTTLSDSLQHLSTLSELTLQGCPALEIDNFPALPCNLSSFTLNMCPNVKSFPHDMHDFTSLKRLKIVDCDGITRFPRGGLPPNLDLLCIGACRNLSQPIEEWGLRGLTALTTLSIWGEMECVKEMTCFPPSPDEWARLLPSSLTILSIFNMKKLERVASGLRAHLPSLQTLGICDCPMMRWLPDEGFPDSLEKLHIWRCCPGIEKKCSKPNGVYWPLVRHIPSLDFTDFEI